MANTLIIRWNRQCLEESDCLIKTKLFVLWLNTNKRKVISAQCLECQSEEIRLSKG